MEKEITRKILLRGITDIMFDRYAGDNKTELPVGQKMYFGEGGKALVLPAKNISSFLSAENTDSAPKRFLDSREYKKVAKAFLSYISISPFEVPFTAKGKPVAFEGFNGQFYIDESVARLPKGIPNPKRRPVLRLPWELAFELTIYPNNEFTEELLGDLFKRGGIAIGLGTFRGVYGKFLIDKWE